MALKIIKGIIAGSIGYFLFGFLVFNVLLGKFSARHTTQLAGFKREDGWLPMVWIFLSCVAYASLLSVVLIGWQKEQDILTELIRGAIIGTLVACMTNFYWYGTTRFFNSFLPVAADIAAAALTVGVMGAIIVWVGRS